MNQRFNTKNIAIYGIIAAIYVVLTIVNPFSYPAIQFRVSEILVLLAFYRKDYAYPLIIGCLIANLFSPFYTDVIFGTLGTIISVVLIMYSKNLFIATLYPVIVNGFVVGAQLYFFFEAPFWISVGSVALGEFVVVSIFGYILFRIISKNKYFMNIIDANQNIELD